jgi:hypothetical protein
MINATGVAKLVEKELTRINNAKLLIRIRDLLVAPYPVERGWDYGAPDEHYICWTVLEDPESNVAIAYCERGFGPKCPWGIVFLSGPHMSIGMDSGWFTTLESAFCDSMAWDEPDPPGHEV